MLFITVDYIHGDQLYLTLTCPQDCRSIRLTFCHANVNPGDTTRDVAFMTSAMAG